MARQKMLIEIDSEGSAEVRLSDYAVVYTVTPKASNLFEVHRTNIMNGERELVAECDLLRVAVLAAMDEMIRSAKADGKDIEGFPLSFRDDPRS